ncbi:MAG: Bro-N domain-containing protein [Bacteroidales bacterium]|nr:Bro-N domain-containing protein [Bacteroidales bacterium]
MSDIKHSESKRVRTVWNENEQKWYFVVSDVVQAVTKAKDAKEYTKKLRKYDSELAKVWTQITCLLETNTKGGRQRMNCAKAPGILRIILSIRSPKVKLFKRWLEGLKISPFERNGKIESSKKSMNELSKLLSNPAYWMEKRERYSLLNEKQPSFKKMNELELIFSMLEENDFIYKEALQD